MARQSGYKVKIEGFIAVDKSNLDSQIEAATAIKKAKASGDTKGLVALMSGVTVTEKMGSAEVDAE